MSQENVDQARRGYDAFNRRDLDAFLALMDPEVEFTTRFAQMEGGPQYRGHDGVRQWWEDLLAIFPDFSVEVLEVRDLGDLAVATLRVRGHGVDSDVPFEETLWGAGAFRHGNAVWWQTCRTEAEALEAAGLSE
jgi:ketosteroid isomerase-like protein